MKMSDYALNLQSYTVGMLNYEYSDLQDTLSVVKGKNKEVLKTKCYLILRELDSRGQL
jgi:hypothetical protein